MPTVRYTEDELPPLTAVHEAELHALAQGPDEAIDTSDLPPLSEDFWKRAARNPFHKPKQVLATVPIDADVLAWLEGQGAEYPSRLNAILRKAMLEELA